MMNRTQLALRWIVIGIVLTGLINGCGRRLVSWKLSPTLAQNSEVLPVPLALDFTYLRGSDFAIRAKDEQSFTNLRKRFEQDRLVMVSFSEESLLTHELPSDPRTHFYLPPTDQRAGYALVETHQVEDLESLALFAGHGEPGFGCGRLKVISFRQVAPEVEHQPPVYEETVRLPTVANLLENPAAADIQADMQSLADAGTRYFKSASGLAATTTIETMWTEAANGLSGVTTEQIDHQDFFATEQKSLILSIPGQVDDDTVVIIGAHLDSINSRDETTSSDDADTSAPGADDDASGIATIAEIIETLAESGVTFNRRIEFHAYSTEEVGLIGSQDIAARYRDAGRKVAAMMQIDMNTYSSDPNDLTIHLVENDTSAVLRRSLKDVLNTYLNGVYSEARLAGGTSDHEAWTNEGFPAVFPFENPADYNSMIHTANDTMATINNLPLAERFAKMGVAFLSHYAGLQSAEQEYLAALSASQEELSTDLTLAILPTEFDTQFAVWISSAAEIATVQICETAEAGATACQGELIPAIFREGDARRFYVGEQLLALSAGSHLLLQGYDADDLLVAQRAVTLR